jgi:uncharacterized protein (TIGR02145 family)
LTSITDSRDGREYALVEIGEQCWFQENLAYVVEDEFYSRCYDIGEEPCDPGQRLYGASTSDFCPTGSHMATDEEWKELERFLGMGEADVTATGWRGSTQGQQLTAAENGGTDTVGFRALFAGSSVEYGGSSGRGEEAFFWTCSRDAGDAFWYRQLDDAHGGILRDVLSTAGQQRYYSVRCLLSD